ncbi:hypothetical protein [Pseudonocardia sp. HH130630-07]|uniref:hypothetical protein n=1 Tax=Pseudonocardia sp. HH130630-07 TaxID=1690815 RepID=UPI0018D3120B|nr:hypothetical protein [Pseudonocardia sp. HH130630-07]
MSAPLDHRWRPESSHRTSDGVVTYLRCHCGAHRIRLDPATSAPRRDLARLPGR